MHDFEQVLPIQEAEQQGLIEIQRLMDEAYRHYFEFSDGHCKAQEGQITVELGNYFNRRDGGPFCIRAVNVYSYVLGPSRWHEFCSVDDALAAVRDWHATEMRVDYSDAVWDDIVD